MSRPNVLIVMTDHQRGDTVRPDHPAETPNLGRFARQGVAFRKTCCPAPHCCPATAREPYTAFAVLPAPGGA